MSLYDQWFQASSGSIDIGNLTSSENETLRQRMLEFTHTAASLLQDYREAYGFKSTPAILFQLAAVAAFILLREMDSDDDVVRSRLALHLHPSFTNNSAKAFEECLRCLMACGVQSVQPRGIARMLYHTAIKSKALLPETVKQMFHIIAETTWQPSDIHLFDSCYPNMILASKSGAEPEEYEMDSVLQKWENIES